MLSCRPGAATCSKWLTARPRDALTRASLRFGGGPGGSRGDRLGSSSAWLMDIENRLTEFLVTGWTVRLVLQRPAGSAEISERELGMTATPPGSEDDELGPVDFLAIEFPGGRLTAPGFEKLISLADQGVIEILDMEFIVRDADGKSRKVDVWEFAVPDGVEPDCLGGAWSGCDDSIVWRDLVGDVARRRRRRCDLRGSRVLDLMDAWQHDGSRLIADGGSVRGRHYRRHRRDRASVTPAMKPTTRRSPWAC